MASVNISIKEDAYEFLKSLKAKDSSFSDVILRFKEKQGILRFFGALKELDWKAKEESMKAFRESFKRRLS